MRRRARGLSSFLVIGVCILAAACTVRSDFTAISSKNVNLSNIEIDPSKSLGRVSGEDCQQRILGIPTSGYPTIDEAIDQALEPSGANLLTDAVVEFEDMAIPFFRKICWRVEGDAYDTFDQ